MKVLVVRICWMKVLLQGANCENISDERSRGELCEYIGWMFCGKGRVEGIY